MCSCRGPGQLGMADRGPGAPAPRMEALGGPAGARPPHRDATPARSVPARVALGWVATGEVALLQEWGGVDKLQQT